MSAADSCGLYYFPEIPCNTQAGPTSVPAQRKFVSGAANDNDGREAADEDLQDVDEVRRLVAEAYNKGLEKGHSEAIAEQQETIGQAMAAFNVAAQELAHIRQQDVERMETETVRLALAIAKKIIMHATEHGSTVGRVVKMALQKVADPRHLTLRLNPQDIDAVKTHQQTLLPDDEAAAMCHIEADETVLQGGCIVETKLGDVDARIDQQIKIIEDQLTAQLPKNKSEV